METVVLKYGNDTVIDTCEAAWTADGGGGFTATQEGTTKKVGTYSAKIVSDGTETGLAAHHNFSSLDIHACNSVQFWIYASVAVSAGVLQLLLDDTNGCVSPLETINLPAIPATTWTIVTLTLATAASDTALLSVGLKFASTKAVTVYLDQIVGVNSKSFNVWSVKGFDGPEDVTDRTLIDEQALDGSQIQYIAGFWRNITIKFGVIAVASDRNWIIVNFGQSNDPILIFANEELDVVFRGKTFEWMNNVRLCRAATLTFQERNVRTTAPDSWT